ncbi:UV radiation resistance associated protein [Amphibalanus amphitrite]|uniref:UV radiation resistance associated protein n=1 Tax=Amphibalanus amphitrite TaxID=1232801 RepID=A0A6A4W9F5_AMPAM|nr:UV radiation resistance-associated gene protein-like isoform X1 [Amphibalanus amphitrite]XP_043217355.1 UV radiation resistance-associated gene protein-like isoform X1 [Amphibalanus amphitrite]XP_043217356.1 UV radiation resistance-associated gene protein-like isoform X1 [Amphibalanus amphitrite]XP_043217357.1 UV radiation resistance-associated gene protein-like isoform X1 [Amphibalanus amphitrite]XP_043217359.1 UV radiation resistance-associated gene protein-like isoform X1 [Amphibalanus am
MSAPESSPAALATNQRRARGLRQLVARHLLATDDVTPRDGVTPLHYRFTLATGLHAAPVYTSEPQLSATAVWERFYLEPVLGRAANATKLLVRVFAQCGSREAEILRWSVALSGLVPVSVRWTFQPNTLLFRFGSVWLTAPGCVADRRSVAPPPLAVSVPSDTVGVASRGPQLERLHRCQRERRQLETAIDEAVREGEDLWPTVERRRRAAAARDRLRARLVLLRADTAARAATVAEARRTLAAARARQAASAAQLARQNDELREDCAALAEWRTKFAALQALYVQAHAQLAFRRRELCAELQVIYPLRRTAEGYTILGIHLPNAEEYSTAPDRAVSVALAHASHLVVMVAWVLGVCLRYPIRQRDAHPVLTDHIVPGLPDGERQFPLQVTGRDSLAFNYAVYLLNKNIAQLRQYCALETSDLRAMLPNLASLLTDAVRPPGEGTSAAPWPCGPLYWPCGPPPAPRDREQSLRLPPASVTLQDAMEDGWEGGSGSTTGAAARGRGSPTDSGALGSEDDSAPPPEPPASLDSAESAAEPTEPTEPIEPPTDEQSVENGVPNSVEEAPAAPPSPPPAPPSPSGYDGPSDDTDWDYVTSRMQILAKPKSFKLVTKRESDEA